MSTNIATGHTAVMAQRRKPPDSLDYFPTPPWATSECDPYVAFQHVQLLLQYRILSPKPDFRLER